MSEHRYQAHATIVPGDYELSVCGRQLQLITITLTDAGTITRSDGTDEQRPDVFCPLRIDEARALAQRLLALADRASIRAVTR